MSCSYDTNFFLQKCYKLPESGSHDQDARFAFHHNANFVVADAMYYARIQAHKEWFRKFGDGTPEFSTKAEWAGIYLTEEQYLQVNFVSQLSIMCTCYLEHHI